MSDEKKLNLIEALTKVTREISSWASDKLDNKVDKVGGKGLSANDYTNADKNKVSSIPNDLVVLGDKLYLAQDGITLDSSAVTLPSGGTGSGSGASITLKNLLDSTILTTAVGAETILEFSFTSSEDDSGGTAYIYVGGNLKGTHSIVSGDNAINIGAYIGEGTNEVKITCMDIYSNNKSLLYTVNAISLRLTSTFDDTQTYTGDINVRYTPYGAVEKTIVFVVDDEIIATSTVSSSGSAVTQVIPALYHGSHLLKIYATAIVNDITIKSNELLFDILYVEDNATTPMIASAYGVTSVTQGELISIPYLVYDPSNMETEITLTITQNDEEYFTSTRVVDRTKQVWNIRNYPVGDVVFTIKYGNIIKSHTITVVANNIDVRVKETDLEFQLRAAGKSNSDNDRDVWTNGDVTTTFEYLNWESTGWVSDVNGDTALRLSGDARATINFMPFKADARQTGKTIEMEFAIRDVNNRDAVAISCLSGSVGFTATADTFRMASEQTKISCNYTDEEKIRIAVVIESRSEYRMMSVYLNGVLSGTEQYPTNDNFQQQTPVNITIGSDYCSVDLYTIRSYDIALTSVDIRNNYIADITDIGEKAAIYADNDIYDAFSNLSFSALKEKIPVLVITGTLPTYKGDKRKVTVSYTDPFNPSLDFEDSASIDVQGTSSQYYNRKNWKIKTSDAHILDVDQVPTRVLCWKVDYAEATGTHNTGIANFAHTLYGDAKTPPQEVDPRVRTTIYGRPCVIFHREDSGSTPVFYGKSNANIDKGGLEVFGFTDEYSDAQCVEFCNNVSEACLFHAPIPDDWSEDFEFRQPDEYDDISDFKIVHDWVVSTWQGGATGDTLNEVYVGADGTQYTNDTAQYRLAKFKKEFTDHFKLDFCLVYYVLTFVLMMVDQRAKNMFLTTWDKVHWEPWLYDNDTCLGINNEGKLVFSPYLEDDDQLDDANVYNGATSALWVNFREAFPDEIQELYASWRSDKLLSYDRLIEYFITRQSDKWSISVYNEDSDFKYVSLLRNDNDGTYLYQIRGTGEEHLKYFIKSRLEYTDSKWCCGDYPSDYISLRIYTPMDENGNPLTDLVVESNPDITITPYSNTYAGVQFGAGSAIAQYKAEQNVPITLPWTMAGRPNDLETSVFPASNISSLGDISPLYCGTVNVSKATKLTELIVGNSTEGYVNNNLTELAVGANNLLQKINVCNCPNLTESLPLANCPNIQEIYATGSSITGVELPTSGYLKKCYLPETLTNLTITNQQYIEEFTLDGYDVLTTLHVEDAINIPVEDIMLNAPNLNRIRLIDVEWNAESEEALVQTIDKFKSCLGLDANGNNTDKAVVTGRVYVAEKVSDETVGDIYNNFPDLIVDDGSDEIYIVNYKDWDGTILYSDRLAEGADAIEPIEAGKINTPSRESDEYYSYEFIGWNIIPTNVSRHYIVTAQYNTKVAINFAVDGQIWYSDYVNYGSNAEDPVATGKKDAPLKEGDDDLRYIFSGWDGSLLNITMPRTVNALFSNVYPVRFYATDSSTLPHHVQWVKEGDDAHDPSTDEGYITPPEILEPTDKKYVFSHWDDYPTNVTSICEVHAHYDTYWAVRFMNEPIDDKGYTEEVDLQWIKDGASAVDPIKRVENPIKEPTKKETAQYYFNFSKWEGDYTDVTGPRVIQAIYTNILRYYNVYFCNMTKDNVLHTVEHVPYGGNASYAGATPIKLGVDNPDDYKFTGWSPLPENIQGDTYCFALFRYKAYLFGKLADPELGQEDQGWGTIDAPNWNAINAYWTQIETDTQAYKNNELTEEEFKLKYPIGGRMIIPVTLNQIEHVVDVEIIEYNHDDLADDSGKAALTFFCKTLPDNIYHFMYTSGVNTSGWAGSDMRRFVNGDLYNALPDSLKSVIRPVLKISDGGESQRDLVTTEDYCWLASYYEVGFPVISSVVVGQGAAYSSTFSTNHDTRVKFLSDGYTACGWWLRSSSYGAFGSSGALFCRVTIGGSLYGDVITNKYPIAFGFCVGQGLTNDEVNIAKTAILGSGALGSLELGRSEG